jgi:galacturan 1,4-alpha-galacturonidase
MLLTNSLTYIFTLLTTFSTLTSASQYTYTGPKNPVEFRKKCPYNSPPPSHRPKFYIRPSRSSTDDISADLLNGLKKANHGGTLVLPKGQTFVIGKKLDLTFLKDIEVNLEGEILFTDNITYWQNNYYYHPFQKSISYWKWGGKDIRIFGNGTLNGNGQAWYDGFAGLEILVSVFVYVFEVGKEKGGFKLTGQLGPE